MRVIHRYAIEPLDPRLEIEVPRWGRVIHVDSILTGVCHFWVEVEVDQETVSRIFVLHETGDEIPPDEYYLGSVMRPLFEYHLYEDLHKTISEEE